jgi:hypothetical protein
MRYGQLLESLFAARTSMKKLLPFPRRVSSSGRVANSEEDLCQRVPIDWLLASIGFQKLEGIPRGRRFQECPLFVR